jgi:hypothetical protein
MKVQLMENQNRLERLPRVICVTLPWNSSCEPTGTSLVYNLVSVVCICIHDSRDGAALVNMIYHT